MTTVSLKLGIKQVLVSAYKYLHKLATFAAGVFEGGHCANLCSSFRRQSWVSLDCYRDTVKNTVQLECLSDFQQLPSKSQMTHGSLVRDVCTVCLWFMVILAFSHVYSDSFFFFISCKYVIFMAFNVFSIFHIFFKWISYCQDTCPLVCPSATQEQLSNSTIPHDSCIYNATQEQLSNGTIPHDSCLHDVPHALICRTFTALQQFPHTHTRIHTHRGLRIAC